MMALYDSTLALLAFNDGKLHAWRIELTTVAKDTPVPSSQSKLRKASKKDKKEAEDEFEMKGDLLQLWPPAHKEDDHYHFGHGQIIDVMASENRFTTKSLSTGLLEWHADLRSEWADSGLRGRGERDGGKGLRSHTLQLLHGDHFSRMGDMKSRMHGEAQLEAGAATSCYVRSTNSVLVAVNQEIIALNVCRADMLKPVLEDLHADKLKNENNQKLKMKSDHQQREQNDVSTLKVFEQDVKNLNADDFVKETEPSPEEELGGGEEKEGKAKHAPTVLTLEVVAAKGLEAMDTGGTSDPYTIVQVAKEKRKTKVIKKNLNPEWAETFEVVVNDVNDILKVSVWDQDLMDAHDFMGGIMIPLQSVVGQEVTQKWYTLYHESRVVGEIMLSIKLPKPEDPSEELRKQAFQKFMQKAFEDRDASLQSVSPFLPLPAAGTLVYLLYADFPLAFDTHALDYRRFAIWISFQHRLHCTLREKWMKPTSSPSNKKARLTTQVFVTTVKGRHVHDTIAAHVSELRLVLQSYHARLLMSDARSHRGPPRTPFDLMHRSAASSGDGSDSEDSEESRVSQRDIRDRPRDLETHFRVRFNASGLATEGGPIGELPLIRVSTRNSFASRAGQEARGSRAKKRVLHGMLMSAKLHPDIKRPLQTSLIVSPLAFHEMTEAGLDKSVSFF